MGSERPDSPGDIDLDAELDEFIAEWDEADRSAAATLCDALAERRGEPPPAGGVDAVAGRLRYGLDAGEHPFAWIGSAAGLVGESMSDGEVELLLRCAAATISPREETGLDPEEEAILLSLQHADWLGAVLSVVRGGPGADASPSALAAGIASCPEVELEADNLDDEVAQLEAAFWILALPWQVLGLTDQELHLTTWGAWALPRALARAWGSEFDAAG